MKLMRNFCCALFALLVTATISAQQTPDSTTGPAGQSVKGAQLKNKAPINPNPLHIDLPKPVEAKLANGLRIVLIEDHKLPTIYWRLVFLERGEAADPKDLEGAARATAAQLREGTTTRSAREFAEQLDVLGASFGGSASTLDSALTMSGLSEHTDKLLDLFSDVLLHPTFPADELERYKTRLISQLQAQRVTPGFMAREQFNKAIYGDHPAAIVAPSDADIKRLTQADLKAFHDRYYRPNIALMFVSGDITMQQLLPKLTKAFKEWQPNDEVVAPLPPVKPPEKERVFVIDRPGAVQTTLLMGELGIRGDDPDRTALSVMNQVLGAGAASRLFMNLREDKGYTYGAYSGVSVERFPGTFSASAEVRTDVTAGAMKEFMYELKRIGTEPVGATELANAKRALVGRFALALEEPASFITNVFQQKIYNFPPDYWDHYAERVDAVTTSDIERVAKKYVDLSKLQIVAVGNGTRIRDVMRPYETAQ